MQRHWAQSSLSYCLYDPGRYQSNSDEAGLDFHPSVHKHKRPGIIISKKHDRWSRGWKEEPSPKSHKITGEVSLSSWGGIISFITNCTALIVCSGIHLLSFLLGVWSLCMSSLCAGNNAVLNCQRYRAESPPPPDHSYKTDGLIKMIQILITDFMLVL